MAETRTHLNTVAGVTPSTDGRVGLPGHRRPMGAPTAHMRCGHVPVAPVSTETVLIEATSPACAGLHWSPST